MSATSCSALLARGAAIVTLLLLAGIIVALTIEAWPSIREYGLKFLVDRRMGSGPGTVRRRW